MLRLFRLCCAGQCLGQRTHGCVDSDIHKQKKPGLRRALSLEVGPQNEKNSRTERRGYERRSAVQVPEHSPEAAVQVPEPSVADMRPVPWRSGCRARP